MATEEINRKSDKSEHDEGRDKAATSPDNNQHNTSDKRDEHDEKSGKPIKDPSATDRHPDHEHERESFQKRELNEDETY